MGSCADTVSKIAERSKIKRRIRYQMKEHRKLDKQAPENKEQVTRSRQTIKTLNTAHDKIDEFLNTSKKRMGQGWLKKEVKSNITDNESAKMTTSKGTPQGFNGVAAVDSKHQIIVDSQAFGEGQEHHTLQPVLSAIKERFKRIGINKDIYATGTVITADTGFANEMNMHYLHAEGINGYIPDNRFRSRDERFTEQKSKYGKRHQTAKQGRVRDVIPSSEFRFDPVNKSCVCPAGEHLSLRGEREDKANNYKVYFEGRLNQCRHCHLKHECMQNPSSADHRKGKGRQVSFILESKRKPNYTDWMKHRVDSKKGRVIYSHRMTVVEPVFGNIGTNKGLSRFSLRVQRESTEPVATILYGA